MESSHKKPTCRSREKLSALRQQANTVITISPPKRTEAEKECEKEAGPQKRRQEDSTGMDLL